MFDWPTGSNTIGSPSGGAGVTVAVKVTASPETDGFSEEVHVIVVFAAWAFTSNTVPMPFDPPSNVVPYKYPALSRIKVLYDTAPLMPMKACSDLSVYEAPLNASS